MLQNVADILQMSVDDLRAQLQQGKTLAQIAQEHGVSPDSLADQLTQRAVQAFQNNQQQLHDRIRQSLDRQLPTPGNRPGPRQQSNAGATQQSNTGATQQS
jgi:transposase-like protein